jgi:hypothetical protein
VDAGFGKDRFEVVLHRELRNEQLVGDLARGASCGQHTKQLALADEWWARLLHNQSAPRIEAALRLTPGVVVTSVPYQLHGAAPTGSAANAPACCSPPTVAATMWPIV